MAWHRGISPPHPHTPPWPQSTRDLFVERPPAWRIANAASSILHLAESACHGFNTASTGCSLAALVLPVAAITPAFAFPLLVVQSFVLSFLVLLYNITQVTFRQRITPPRLLGRMNASVRFVVWGVMPLAALLAGGLGTWLGVIPTMWIGAIGQLLAAGFVLFGPFWSLRRLPDAPTAGSSRG